MNKLCELLTRGNNVTIGRHSSGTGFFLSVETSRELKLWREASHGHTPEEVIENALKRGREPETLYTSEDFEITGEPDGSLDPITDIPDVPIVDAPDFRDELRSLINRFSLERESNTPDWVLRDFLSNCLDAFDRATNSRDGWYDLNLKTVGEES